MWGKWKNVVMAIILWAQISHWHSSFCQWPYLKGATLHGQNLEAECNTTLFINHLYKAHQLINNYLTSTVMTAILFRSGTRWGGLQAKGFASDSIGRHQTSLHTQLGRIWTVTWQNKCRACENIPRGEISSSTARQQTELATSLLRLAAIVEPKLRGIPYDV